MCRPGWGCNVARYHLARSLSTPQVGPHGVQGRRWARGETEAAIWLAGALGQWMVGVAGSLWVPVSTGVQLGCWNRGGGHLSFCLLTVMLRITDGRNTVLRVGHGYYCAETRVLISSTLYELS